MIIRVTRVIITIRVYLKGFISKGYHKNEGPLGICAKRRDTSSIACIYGYQGYQDYQDYLEGLLGLLPPAAAPA